ncbi:MAG: hypothetical protein AB1333_02215 [Patescibacteria group bacterium]
MSYFIPIFSAFIFLILFIFQIFNKTFSDVFRLLASKWIFVFSVLGIIFWYLYLTGLQYFIWVEAGPPSSFFLPPHTSILYLFQYHLVRFLMYYCISFVIAVLFLIYGKRYNKKFGSKFFEDEELYIGGIAIFLLGNPLWTYLWIFYLLVILLVGLLGTFYINKILKRREDRFPFYYLWMPLAIVAIIIAQFLY